MKTLCLFALLCVGAVVAHSEDVDLDKYFNNRALVKKYLACVLGSGPCDAFGTYMKKEAVATIPGRCGDCVALKKRIALAVFERLQREYPEEWKMLLEKYDPEYVDDTIEYYEDE